MFGPTDVARLGAALVGDGPIVTREGAGWDHVAWRVEGAVGSAWIVRAATRGDPTQRARDVRREVARGGAEVRGRRLVEGGEVRPRAHGMHEVVRRVHAGQRAGQAHEIEAVRGHHFRRGAYPSGQRVGAAREAAHQGTFTLEGGDDAPAHVAGRAGDEDESFGRRCGARGRLPAPGKDVHCFGMSTASITWMTPLLVWMSVLITRTPSTVTPPPVAAMASEPPCTVVADFIFITSAAVTRPATT